MSKFNKKGNNFNNKDNNKRRPSNSTNNDRPKVVYVAKDIPVGYSQKLEDVKESLYKLLSEITFDKIVIPVKMYRSEFNDDNTQQGTMILGSAISFDNENKTFKVSMKDTYANIVNKNTVVSVKARIDRDTKEVTYITELCITNDSEPMELGYAMEQAAQEEDTEKATDEE